MSTLKLTITAAAISLAGGAMAQDLEGARLSLEYGQYDDGQGFEVTSLELLGDVSMLFDNGFGGQLTLGLQSDVDFSDSSLEPATGPVLVLHGFTDISPETRLGAYLGYNKYDDAKARLYGVEMVHQADRLRLETRLGRYDSDLDYQSYSFATLYADYALNARLQLRGTLRYEDFGENGHYGLAMIGLGYDLGDRARLYAEYGWQDQSFGSGYADIYGGNLLNLGVEITLGDTPAPKIFRFDPQF